MTTDDHFHLDSLKEFRIQLADAGFQRVPESDFERWTGRAHPALAPLTDVTTMDIVILPGWPFQPPAVFVEGLNTNHSTPSGLVCMWREGDFNHEWAILGGLFSRLEEWCENAINGWEDDHLDQDALLNFPAKRAIVATFDLFALGVSDGGWGECHGVVRQGPLPRVDIYQGRKPQADNLRGMWFHVGTLDTPPPRRLAEVPCHLTRAQRRELQRVLADRRKSELLAVSGGVDLILFCWERLGRPNILVMACTGTDGEVDAVALQLGPYDTHSLRLRAGPDAPALATSRATVFGAGALGGHTALLLSESGVGYLDIVDPDVLLPGNMVRHVAGGGMVGAYKVQAVQAVTGEHAPWTEVAGFPVAPRTPGAIRERIDNADIVVDTTGNEALVRSLAMMAEDMGKPLVSGALYRGGCIARVQRQAMPKDTPINQRADSERYPAIPVGDESEDFVSSQLGCSAPVNNAAPSAVTACSSLITQVSVDVLTERFEFADEVIDVYRAIPDLPFNRIGRISGDAG